MQKFGAALLFACCAVISGCSGSETAQEEGVSTDPDTAPYSGITAEEMVTLVGTEPFWGAEITDGTLKWTTPENIEGQTIEITRFAGNNGLGFSGTLDGKVMQLAVTPGDCSDGMSDRTYPFTATVIIGERQFFGCGYTDSRPFSGEETP